MGARVLSFKGVDDMGKYEFLGPDAEAFGEVVKQLEDGEPLSFTMIGEVFGPEFYELLLMTLLDAQDAARAIQGALNRLATKGGIRSEIREAVENYDADAAQAVASQGV